MDKDFKDYIDSKTFRGTLQVDNSTKTVMGREVLLQLLVFEHATGDVTVQIETGFLRLTYTHSGEMSGGIRHIGAGTTSALGKCSNIREAIDKAVAEQFGRKPEPCLYRDEKGDVRLQLWVTRDVDDLLIVSGDYEALCKIAGKELPVVDASESQVKSEWKQVFPLEVDLPGYAAGSYLHIVEQMRKETAFTIWRLTVVR